MVIVCILRVLVKEKCKNVVKFWINLAFYPLFLLLNSIKPEHFYDLDHIVSYRDQSVDQSGIKKCRDFVCLMCAFHG